MLFTPCEALARFVTGDVEHLRHGSLAGVLFSALGAQDIQQMLKNVVNNCSKVQRKSRGVQLLQLCRQINELRLRW